MKVGGKSSLVCRSDLAYGDQGPPVDPWRGRRYLQVELREIRRCPSPQVVSKGTRGT